MKWISCMILVITILVCGLAFASNVHATTTSGPLTADTHWTLMDTPIIFNGTVTVGNGVTLTIDPGVTVNLGIYSLQVGGTLIAAGDVDNKILFTVRDNVSQYLSEPIFFTQNSTGWVDATKFRINHSECNFKQNKHHNK